jgi:hypothetical protein
VIGLVLQVIASALSRHGNCNHYFTCAGAHGADCSQHTGPGGEPVVYQDGEAALDRFRWTAIPVSTFPSLNLPAFLFGCRLNHLFRDVEFTDDVGIEGHDPIRRDCAHRQLCKSGYTEFANSHDIEREMQSERNFISYRDTPTRQTKDDSILAPPDS